MKENITDILIGNEKEDDGKDTVTSTQNVSQQMEIESQFYCDALKESNINGVLSDLKPELIVLVGMIDYGKSTFVGSLYHLLRKHGELGDYKFIDSDTYAGFERRVFLRKDNPTGISNVKRSIRGENYFLTFDIEHKLNKERRKVILSDRAGEIYRDYISNVELLNEDKSLYLADRIMFFIDSKELLSTQYSNIKDNYKSLLVRLKKNEKISEDSTKYIVFNKYDLVSQENMTKFEERKKAIISTFHETCQSDKFEVFCIDSKNIGSDDDNSELKKLFIKIINPIDKENTNDSTLDWVKSSINAERNGK